MNCKKSGPAASGPDTLIQLQTPLKSLPSRENVSKTVSRVFRILPRRDIQCYKLSTYLSPGTSRYTDPMGTPRTQGTP